MAAVPRVLIAALVCILAGSPARAEDSLVSFAQSKVVLPASPELVTEAATHGEAAKGGQGSTRLGKLRSTLRPDSALRTSGTLRPDDVRRAREAREGMAAQGARYQVLGEQLNPRGKIDRVVYPMAGADAFAAFRMFAGPRGMPTQAYLIDDVPFGGPQSIADTFANAEQKHRYLGYLERHDFSRGHMISSVFTGGLGAMLLWELERLGARRLEVEYLDRDGRPLSTEQVAQLNERRQRRPRKNAVRVSFYLDGRPRELVYVQHRFGQGHLPEILSRFLTKGYDALLQKAAGTAGTRNYADLSALLQKLDRRHGIFVSDESLWQDMARFGLVALRRSRSLAARFGYTAVSPRVPRPAVYVPVDDGLTPHERLRRGMARLAELAGAVTEGKTPREQRQALQKLAELGKDGLLSLVSGRARQLHVAVPEGAPENLGAVVKLGERRFGRSASRAFNESVLRDVFTANIDARGGKRAAQLVFGRLLEGALAGQERASSREIYSYFSAALGRRVSLDDVLTWLTRIDRVEARRGQSPRARKGLERLRESLKPVLVTAIERSMSKKWVHQAGIADIQKTRKPPHQHLEWEARDRPWNKLRQLGRKVASETRAARAEYRRLEARERANRARRHANPRNPRPARTARTR